MEPKERNMKDPILYMAPLKGFTDWMFRKAFAEHFGGFDLAVAPFIASKSDCKIKRKFVRDVLPEHNESLPVVPQILGKSGEDFAFLADYLYDLGYETVNWNLGCPYAMVAKKMRGSGMLPHPEMIDIFLDTALRRMKPKLSIKIRLGYKSPDEIFRLVPILNRYPLEELIVHPRTGVQYYDGEVDLEAFEKLLERIDHRIVYNGDIKTPEHFRRLSERFEKVERWMIGRWCIADPFLPSAIKDPTESVGDKVRRIKGFHEALFYEYQAVLDGPSHLLNKMKGLWRYLSLPFEDFKKSMKNIKKATRPEQYLELVNRFFDTEAKPRSFNGNGPCSRP